MFRLTCILFISILFAQCAGGSKNSEIETLHDQVMEIHDEVMPKMRDINQMKKKVRKLSSTLDEAIIQQHLNHLDEADEKMMSWMAQYKKPGAQDVAAAKAYLSEQMILVKDVKDSMLKAISDAQKLVDAYDNTNDN